MITLAIYLMPVVIFFILLYNNGYQTRELNMMQGSLRREQIYQVLVEQKKPISASTLSKRFGVSRQIIVGDIALLRALGHLITATPRGYVIETIDMNLKVKQVLVKHTKEQTKFELLVFVKHHIIVKDVIIDHPQYGMIRGDLNIKTKQDVETFLNKKTSLLSDLTNGIHIHTLYYLDENNLDLALKELDDLGFLFE